MTLDNGAVPPLHIEQRLAAFGAVEVLVTGDVDLATAPALRSALLATLNVPDVEDVLVNQADVGFMDSTGLGALVTGRNAATAAGRSFHVTECSPRVRVILEITGLDKVMLRGPADEAPAPL